MTTFRKQLFRRYEGNPILTSRDWPYTVNGVFNPGVAVDPDGSTVLLVRVEDRSGVSHLTVAGAGTASPTGTWTRIPASTPTSTVSRKHGGSRTPASPKSMTSTSSPTPDSPGAVPWCASPSPATSAHLSAGQS